MFEIKRFTVAALEFLMADFEFKETFYAGRVLLSFLKI